MLVSYKEFYVFYHFICIFEVDKDWLETRLFLFCLKTSAHADGVPRSLCVARHGRGCPEVKFGIPRTFFAVVGIFSHVLPKVQILWNSSQAHLNP